MLASAIVSVGDTDVLIKTAANRFFAKPEADQVNTLTDLLSSSARRAINLLTHDQLFSAKGPSRALSAGQSASVALATAQRLALTQTESGASMENLEDDDDPLAVIIRKACSRELTDLGLTFNSLNIKVVQSEVADARRRMSAAEAQATADIVQAQQARRAKEATIEAERIISDRQRELEQTKAGNAALIAQAEAKRQEAMGVQRVAELEATQIAQARADAGARHHRGAGGGGCRSHPHSRRGVGAGGEHPEGERGDQGRRRELLPLPADRDAADHRAADCRRTRRGAAHHGVQR